MKSPKCCPECTQAIEAGFDNQLVVVHPGCVWAYIANWVASDDAKVERVRVWTTKRRELYRTVLEARRNGTGLEEAVTELSIHEGLVPTGAFR